MITELVALAAVGLLGPAAPRAIAAPPGAAGCVVGLGQNASLNGMRPFPGDSPWNREVAQEPVDPRSWAIIASIGADYPLRADFGSGRYNGARIGIPYVVVPEDQPMAPVEFTDWPEESDPGPYPIPPDAPIENAGTTADYSDAHVIVVQRDCSRPNGLGKLYELFQARPVGDYPRSVERWRAANGAVFDLNSNALRKAGHTSADAAGLPIFPGLARYDEVAAGEIRHALRVTVSATRKAYVHPARHWASYSSDPLLPPMGMRLRLKAGVDISKFPPQARVILRALKKYGMIVADHGANWFISGAPDERWDNDALFTLGYLTGRDLEVVKMSGIVAP